MWSVEHRHSIDAFQPPSRAAGGQSSVDASETPTDTTLPNIVRPNYNDLRSADDAVEADDGDGGSEEQGSQVNISVIVAVLYAIMLWHGTLQWDELVERWLAVNFHGQQDFSVRPNYLITRLWTPLPVVVHAELILDRARSAFC